MRFRPSQHSLGAISIAQINALTDLTVTAVGAGKSIAALAKGRKGRRKRGKRGKRQAPAPEPAPAPVIAPMPEQPPDNIKLYAVLGVALIGGLGVYLMRARLFPRPPPPKKAEK